MTWGTITDERIAEAEALINVPLRRDRMQWIETATRDAIRHFAWGIGCNNPLWLDRDYAASSPYGTLVAPPCILYAVDGTVVETKEDGSSAQKKEELQQGEWGNARGTHLVSRIR